MGSRGPNNVEEPGDSPGPGSETRSPEIPSQEPNPNLRTPYHRSTVLMPSR